MERYRRLLAVLDVFTEKPSVTPVELDEAVDEVIEEGGKEGDKLSEPSPEFRKSAKKRIVKTPLKKTS